MVNSCWGERDSVLSAPLRAPHATLGTNPCQETREEGANVLTADLSKFRRTSRVS
jgi:hypothetical protein